MVISDLFLAEVTCDVGVHCATLDRPRPDQSYLDYQVLDLRNPDAQQDLDLGAALNLDDAQYITALDHGVDALIVQLDVLGWYDNAAVALTHVTQAAV